MRMDETYPVLFVHYFIPFLIERISEIFRIAGFIPCCALYKMKRKSLKQNPSSMLRHALKNCNLL